ncbi:MAG TPA: ABC transporter permease [Acidimicrobiales bacterium]|nr:ABC transporter permease [Acidimicrobiales bacterium]
MRFVLVLVIVAVALGLRILVRQTQRNRRLATESDEHGVTPLEPSPHRGGLAIGANLGGVGLVARREILERVRGRIFRVGTIIILLAVGAAIVIPKIHSSTTTPPQKVGVVGAPNAVLTKVIKDSGRRGNVPVRVVSEQSEESARAALRDGDLDVAIVNGDKILVNQPVSSDSTTDTATVVQVLAPELGVLRAYQQAGLSAPQIEQVSRARPVPVESLQHTNKNNKDVNKGTSVIGVILIFLMLNQYNTWILMGVMQEKASRVVEVLLAALRPIQLLGGKVLGIGLVAMGQAILIVGFAFILSKAVGSDLLRGTGALLLLSDLVWLILGYAFYCWLFAAAGSMAERQDQVQTLALPLTLPILIAYVFSITVASSGNPSLLFKVLAYLPPTAPFAMPVLVGLDQVAWWQFLISVLLAIAGTAVMAWIAAGIYRRAVLKSGQRVKLRELQSGPRRPRPTSRPTVDPA